MGGHPHYLIYSFEAFHFCWLLFKGHYQINTERKVTAPSGEIIIHQLRPCPTPAPTSLPAEPVLSVLCGLIVLLGSEFGNEGERLSDGNKS